MSFPANPLALSIPEPVFEAWLRDSGYLEILDASSSSSPPFPTSSALFHSSSSKPLPLKAPAAVAGAVASAFFVLRTIASILSINPFAKLTTEDFAGETPSWTLGFVGGAGSYSWPGGPSQARMRVQENVRRYARNYALLTLIFFACSLYQMPVPLLGLMASLGLWELVRVCDDKWELGENCPLVRTIFVRFVQFAVMVILYVCNLQMAVFCTTTVSFTVMILHASLRKLSPSKHSRDANHRRRSQQKKLHLSANQDRRRMEINAPHA